MRFNSINIYSDENENGELKKEITIRLRLDSDNLVDKYLKLLKYYNNKQCKSLNIACNENINTIYLEQITDGYPIVHYPFDFSYYQTLEEENIAPYWLDVIHESVCFIADKWGWDFSIFENIYGKLNLNNHVIK